ncbi:hypothetical protein LguiA_011980 [Lonicera macranthoides]
MQSLCLPSTISSFKYKPSSSIANAPKKYGKFNNAISAASNKERGLPDIKLPADLRPELMPKHVALFPDGQRRWAKERGLTMEDGDRAGANKIKEFVKLCSKYGIKVVTVFGFSTENWVRPKVETDILMRLNSRVSMIGDRSKWPKSLQGALSLVKEVTKKNTGLHVLGGINYGGRYDILQACKSVASKVKDGLLQLEDINESVFELELETKCTEFPSADLVIRTSGAHRLSNFMLWQAAYSELFFVEKLFPDIEEEDFIEALKSYRKKEKRHGGQQNY